MWKSFIFQYNIIGFCILRDVLNNDEWKETNEKGNGGGGFKKE